MHAAPSVRVSVGRGWGWPAFVGVCAGATVGNLLAWRLLHEELRSIAPLALLAAAVAGAMTAWRLHRSQAIGDLQWDGAQWLWRGVAGQAQVAIDLGGWLLLRFEPHAGPRQWIAAARARTEGPWAAFRAAPIFAAPGRSPRRAACLITP